MSETTRKKKLIEVALPLDEINAACKADKDRKTGTIRNIHKWFAPMPLPAWRALLFAALVDDPADDERRAYLLDVIKRLVANGANLPDDDTVEEARKIITKQFPEGVPAVMDPFCGGGSTLVEAQRLGLPTFGSDLNPVPVLITRTLTEILPKVYGRQPLHPEPASSQEGSARSRKKRLSSEGQILALIPEDGTVKTYAGYGGLARDVKYYANKIDEVALNMLAQNYPARPGETPMAWIWARTAICPNPACGVETILATSWWLSKKAGGLAWVEPRVASGVIDLHVRSEMKEGAAPESPKIGDGVFSCIACAATLDGKYLRAQGKSGNLALRMMAVVHEKEGKRCYREPTAVDISAASLSTPDTDFASIGINGAGQGIRVGLYGIDTWDKLFTPRQFLALSTVADLVAACHQSVLGDGGSQEWADAITTLLGLAIGRMAQYQSSLVRWFIDSRSGSGQPLPAFARHDIPMQWDFVESAPTSAAGSISGAVNSIIASFSQASNGVGKAVRRDARSTSSSAPALVATDPPYFDAIGYADHSDYFYIWHRRALRGVHPDLYITAAAPKAGELTAIHSHHGNSKDAAREYFINGFTEVFRNLQTSLLDGLPMIVVYASKEKSGGSNEVTRWSSILSAIVAANLEITGTWPIRGTKSDRLIGLGTNAVATYIAMVVRPRLEMASTTSLAEFNRALRRELSPAIRDLQAASILPVDLAQAAMGPGMQIFSRYRAVLDQGGKPVGVGQALRLINSALAEVLDEQEGELEPESRFAVRWWEAYGWTSASFGDADKTARPLGISVDDVVRAEVATSQANKVQLLGSGQLDRDWHPSKDAVPTAWEAVHHLADRLIDGGGELEAARLMGRLGPLQDSAMALAYRLHDIAAKKGRTSDQERYNALISSWAELIRLSGDTAEELF